MQSEVEVELMRGSASVLREVTKRDRRRFVEVLMTFAAVAEVAELPDRLLAAGVARQKWREELVSVAGLPRTSGKIQKVGPRNRLRERAS